jgi:hypothetical protein
MSLVNGKRFEIFTLDNVFTFKNRLAASLNTLQSFLYFPNQEITNELIRDTDNDITVINILDEIKIASATNTSVIDLVKSIQEKIGNLKFNKGKDIIKLWLAYNKILEEKVFLQGNTPLISLGKYLKNGNLYISETEINSDWNKKSSVKKFLEIRIVNNKKETESNINIFKEYSLIKIGNVFSDFYISNVQFVLELDIFNLSLLEIFNSLKVNEYSPFITTKDFYKISTDFVPPEEWIESYENSLVIYTNQRKIGSKSNFQNYEKVIVRVDPLSNNMTTEITVNTEKNNINRQEFTERVLSVFKDINPNITKNVEGKVVGVFFIPNMNIRKYVLTDLIMNDPIFTRLITIDDRDKATKIKPGIYFNFYHPSTGVINATLTTKTMIKNDQNMKKVDKNLFDIGSFFLRIKVSKAENLISVNIFKDMLGKLLSRYKQKEEEIINYYKQYIPNFGEIAPEVLEIEKELKPSELVKGLFVSKYTRNCKADRMVSIVSLEEANNLNLETIKFPRDVPDNPLAFKFPMDGEDQHYYVCKSKEYKYPGLKGNKLSNSETYPYVPCCYKKKQTLKKKYLNYYEGKEIIMGENKQNNIIVTNKILKNNQLGTLPKNIENLFTIIEPEYQYVRKGVNIGNSSFLNVILEALGIGKDKNDEDLMKIRSGLATKKYAPLCRQEMYDESMETIIKKLEDPEVYLDPKLFINLIEETYKCNIYLFSRKTLSGEMILPRHLQSYYKNINNNKCIYVYEHMGSESDYAKMPQCELIIRNSKKLKMSFTKAESQKINEVYSMISKSYALNTLIRPIVFPINVPEVTLYSQSIDSYGKTRIVNINYNNNDIKSRITIFVTPIQPLSIVETPKDDIFLADYYDVLDFIKTLKIEIVSYTIIEDTIKEISGRIGNVDISIPVNHKNIEKLSSELLIKNNRSYPDNLDSKLSMYNQNKKMARILVEYSIWMYSKYLNEKNITLPNDDTLSNFSENNFLIDKDYEYINISKKLSRKSSILSNKTLIIVKNEETVKRLVYTLRIISVRNLDSLLLYRTNKVMKNYYVDVTDFDNSKNQIILYGSDSVDSWILENSTKYIIYDEIQLGISVPYFFKNKLIDNTVYLAQNVSTIEKASSIAVSWYKQGYNINNTARDIEPVSFLLYSYKNRNDIIKKRVIAESFDEIVKILGYKIDDKSQYTVLLQT